MTTFDTARNLVSSTLGADRADGAAIFPLAAGTGAIFGTTFPLLFAATPASNFDEAGRIVDRSLVAYYRATGRTGDNLTGCTLVEGTDRALASGDVVAIYLLAQHVAQLQAAVNGVEMGIDARQPLHANLTGLAALVDPDADRIVFWDDSAGTFAFLAPGTNLSIAGTALDASGGGGSGSVTSVGLALPSIFTVSGSPVATSGTLTGTLATQAPNRVWAGPATGVDAVPTFRTLVSSDVPDLTQYHTDARALTWLGTRSTADLPEGVNLYYTQVRADARVAAGIATHEGAGDPHPQYLTAAEGNAAYAAAVHTHVVADTTGLQAALDSKGSGTVTSVAMTVPGVLFSVAGSPVTTAGTLALSLLTQTANTVLAGPASGGAATPTMRALVDADIPAGVARLASPALTGTPTAPTAAPATNTTQVATTAFVLANAGGGGSTLPVADTTAIVKGSADATKLLRFEVDGFAAGTTRVLTPPNQDGTLALLERANVYTVGGQAIKTGADGTVGLEVWRNSSTQTAALLRLLDSDGTTVLASWSKNARLLTTPSRLSLGSGLSEPTADQQFNIGLSNTCTSSSINVFIFGLGCTVSGTGSGATVGISNIITGSGSFSFGNGCNVSATSAMGMGFSCTVSGSGLVALGNTCTVSGNRSIGMGTLASATRAGLLAFGAADQDAILNLQRFSSTSVTRDVLDVTASWATSTDASRKGRTVFSVYDTAAREALRLEASGTAAMIGFLGAAAVVRPTVTGSRADGTALASLLTALATLGLITDSSTA